MVLSDYDLKLLNEFNEEYNKKISVNKNSSFNKETKDLLHKIRQNKNLSIIQYKENKKYNFVVGKDLTLGIDRKSDKKLTSGKYKIDFTLDLHGETLETAYDKVKRIFKLSEINNYRCLLIITGKGLHSNSETIKTSIIEWFKEPYFSDRIIKYTDANIKDGGSGAIYVLLRNIDSY